jgi:CDP-diacylglycerol--glycerol-3-phosphate 3-phosphatidyltransferase
MDSTTFQAAAAGLYQVKPGFQGRLGGTADWLARRGAHPDVLTYASLACGVAGGLALALGTRSTALLWLVPPLAGLRLTGNALDGMVATRRGLARPWGKVLNEFADRLADVAFLGPLLLVPGANHVLVTAAMCLTLMVSYLGVLAEAAGAGRQYGGPMGKADRMLWLGLACAGSAATGSLLPLQALPLVLLVGGLATLVQRGGRTHAAL